MSSALVFALRVGFAKEMTLPRPQMRPSAEARGYDWPEAIAARFTETKLSAPRFGARARMRSPSAGSVRPECEVTQAS